MVDNLRSSSAATLDAVWRDLTHLITLALTHVGLGKGASNETMSHSSGGVASLEACDKELDNLTRIRSPAWVLLTLVLSWWFLINPKIN